MRGRRGQPARFVLIVVLSASCGSPPDPCMPGGRQPPLISGEIYLDTDESSRTAYHGGAGDGDIPLAGHPVYLETASSIEVASSCDNGSFYFSALPPGTYRLEPEVPAGWRVTTRNLPRRLGRALDTGGITVVAIGDSLPVEGAVDRFPEIIADRLNSLGDVELHNRAEGGTTTEEWSPSGYLFERNRPLFERADLLLVSLGGDDMLFWLNDRLEQGDLDDLDRRILAETDEIVDRLVGIFDAIRSINAGVEIAYILYPNYAASDAWGRHLGVFQDYATTLFAGALQRLLESIERLDPVLAVDLFGLFSGGDYRLDDYLADELHFNYSGHGLIAVEILRVLGIFVIEDSGFRTRVEYGLARP